MRVLVDTSLWSLAFRRRKEVQDIQESVMLLEINELIQQSKVVIIGPIRQEILSGITVEAQFEKLKDNLKVFEDLKLTTEDYEVAAEFYNQCRRKGVQGSHIDFLICAVAHRNNIPIFTTDKDFYLYSKHVDISLYKPHFTFN
ncbi:MAG TPA: PIN domain-containing protein [Candidatus Deferrimicrobium sp.]|nr:PIN domain-containing protein [Candidatus Deferrimicrobium sp.]